MAEETPPIEFVTRDPAHKGVVFASPPPHPAQARACEELSLDYLAAEAASPKALGHLRLTQQPPPSYQSFQRRTRQGRRAELVWGTPSR